MMTWIPLLASDPFYEARLKAGRTALAAQHPLEAVDQLRIASFGLLDSPKQLSESLALLSLAQSALGRTSELEITISRFIEAETRFASYDPAVLEPPGRAQFESLLIRSVPKPTLASIPSLARLVAPTGGVKPAASQTTRPLAAPANRPSTAADASREGTQAIDTSEQMIRQGHAPEAAELLNRAVTREPNRRDLRLALLQAASMAANWSLASAQLPKLMPFADGESVWMFYAAVALFETGSLPEARALVERALPKLHPSPYVDYYVRRIAPRPGS